MSEVFDSSDLGIFQIRLESIIYIHGMHSRWLIRKFLWQEVQGMVYYIIFFLFSLIGLVLSLASAVRNSMLLFP